MAIVKLNTEQITDWTSFPQVFPSITAILKQKNLRKFR